MSKTVKFDVLRDHEGDRFYKEGDTRELAESSAKHLVALGVLAPHDPHRQRRVSLSYDELATRRDVLKVEIEDLMKDRDGIKAEIERLKASVADGVEDLEVARAELTTEIVTLRAQREDAVAGLSEMEAKTIEARKNLDALMGEIKLAEDRLVALDKRKDDPKSDNKAEGSSPKNKSARSSEDQA